MIGSPEERGREEIKREKKMKEIKPDLYQRFRGPSEEGRINND